MFYPNYLIHFNPYHDPKTGQFTFSKYVDSFGRLSSEGRKRFGVDEALKQKNLRKSISTMSRNMNRHELAWEETEEKLNNDIKSASNNKEFVSDLKKEVKKYIDAYNKGEDYLEKWYDDPNIGDYKDGDFFQKDQWEESIKTLQNKYPQYKDMLYMYNPWGAEKIGFDKWVKSGDMIRSVLEMTDDITYDTDINSEQVNKILEIAKNDFVEEFRQKYGDQAVNKAMKAINTAGSGNSILW